MSSVFAQTVSAQQAEDPNVLAGARALAVDGVKLAQDGHCDDAIDKLERAEKLHHSAIVLEQLGECYIEKGRVVEGAEAMRSVLREGQPETASEALKRANTNARTLLETTKSKIANLTITVEVPAGNAEAVVEVDGQPLPAALIGAARPTDPGEHTVEASAPGHLPARRHVTLAPGQADGVALTLAVDPTANARAASLAKAQEEELENAGRREPAATTEATGATETHTLNHLPAYIAWGVAGAGLAVGIGYGWVAMNEKSELDKACPDHRCPAAQSKRLDAAKSNGVVSTVAFAAGLGAAVAGGLLFFLVDGSSSETPPSAASVRLGPAAAELAVKF